MNSLINLSCRSDANILITGPTGTGKSTLARRIHEMGARADRPLVTINLATVHEGTLESELFGHERGAFTGADHRRIGRLEAADGGTVFLDEIGELPPRLQARLLDFLQSRVVVPVGSNRELQLNVRVISATHRDLEKQVEKGLFREDLFHRLRVISLELRSLRERQEDFDQFVHELLEESCRSAKKSVFRLSEAVAVLLEQYSWPGNLRELRNVLEFAVLSAENSQIEVADLPEWFIRDHQRLSARASLDSPLGVAEVPLTLSYREATQRFERQYILWALNRFGGRVNYTARQIGINKATLMRRMRNHGIHGKRELSFSVPNISSI